MKKSIVSTLVSAALVTAAAAPALAQTGGSAAEGPVLSGAEGPQARHFAQRQHDGQRASRLPSERIEARLAYLKTALKITDAQLPQWEAFADTLRKHAKKLVFENKRTDPQAGGINATYSGWRGAINRIGAIIPVAQPLGCLPDPHIWQPSTHAARRSAGAAGCADSSCSDAAGPPCTAIAQARRIAERGFAVLAPDYHSPRFIPAWPVEHDPETERDVELALDYLKTVPEARSDRVCVVGISRGGYHAVLLAARRKEVACIVTYYGHMVNPNAPEPWQVYRYAPEVQRIHVPVLFIVGEDEFEVRRIGIRRAYYALLERGVPVDIVMYPHARRAFDFRADQREEEKLATEDAARRTAEFLRRVLAP